MAQKGINDPAPQCLLQAQSGHRPNGRERMGAISLADFILVWRFSTYRQVLTRSNIKMNVMSIF